MHYKYFSILACAALACAADPPPNGQASLSSYALLAFNVLVTVTSLTYTYTQYRNRQPSMNGAAFAEALGEALQQALDEIPDDSLQYTATIDTSEGPFTIAYVGWREEVDTVLPATPTGLPSNQIQDQKEEDQSSDQVEL